jgi:hypothetical protein
VLVAAGVEQSTALSYAISVHLLSSLWIVGSGLVAFWALGISPRQVFSVTRVKADSSGATPCGR